MRFRFKLYSLAFLLTFLLLVARLYYWQILKGKVLSASARDQYQKSYEVIAPRGNIIARDGTYLVAGEPAWLAYIYLPEAEEDVVRIADKLAPLFADENEEDGADKAEVLAEADRLKKLLTKDGISWVPLKHKIDSNIKKNIEALKISGIGFDREERRVYPEASSAAHILGFVGKNSEGEDQGYFGLEGYYDLTLSGKPGYLTRESDARGIPILAGDEYEVSAIGGVDLLTTLDKTVQIIVEKNLKEGLQKYGAATGTVIVMNPKTGGIMAMASFPAFDQGKYRKYTDELFKNPATSSSFEPGSIFKILVMAAALDSGVVEPDTKCEICAGALKVGKYYIDTWDGTYRPDSTMVDVIVNSDNVGMAFVAQKLGVDTFYEYMDNFGIGKLSNVDLQGEFTPKLRDKDTWNIVDLSVAGFGQGIAITPIQFIKAVTAIANKGVLVSPYVVDKIIGDGWIEEIKHTKGKVVISERTASEVTAMMVEAAKNGEAKWTHMRGFKVAGKTGTAQIPIEGHYDKEKTIASFVGFAPADEPKFLMLVTLKEPSSSPWASETAAPLWYSIAKDLFLYFGIQPEN